MGIYPQPNPWECGPFALKHGLLVLGIFEHERTIARLAGTDRSGTDEVELGRAARHLGCDLLVARKHDAEDARQKLIEYLDRTIPVLLCVHQWDHWVTVVAAEENEFVVLDSHDPAVLTIVSWDRLREIWMYRRAAVRASERVRAVYDLHPLLPRQPPRARARFSRSRARFLSGPSGRGLAQAWTTYGRTLLEVAERQTDQCELSMPLVEMVGRHEAAMVDAVLDSAGARDVLERIRFVAETYDLTVSMAHELRAVASLRGMIDGGPR